MDRRTKKLYTRDFGICKWHPERRESGGEKLTYFVKVEREIAGQGAVESGFQERSPTIGPAVRTTLVVLANAGHP